MQSATYLSENWMLVVAALGILTLAGLIVLVKGMRPRRRGSTPYCRGCGYNLTGSTLDGKNTTRCPECGRSLNHARAVVIGSRRIRRRVVVLGTMLVSIGFVGLAGVGVALARNVNWYHYKPTSWVLSDLQNGGANLASRASAELRLRMETSGLSSAQTYRLAEIGLGEQRKARIRLWWASPIELLGLICERGELTPEQRTRFFQNLLLIRARARSPVTAGDDVPVEFHYEWRGSNRIGFEVTCDPGPMRIEANPFYDHEMGKPEEWRLPAHGLNHHDDPDTGDRTGWSILYEQFSRPGNHVLKYDFKLSVYRRRDPNLLDVVTKTIELPVIVLESEPVNSVRVVRSRELDALVKDSVAVCWGFGRQIVRGDNVWASITLKVEPSTDLAFDVVMQYGDTRRSLGSVVYSSFRGISHFVLTCDLSPDFLDTATFILKPSIAAAKRTADVDEIWGGALRFANVDWHRPDNSKPTPVPFGKTGQIFPAACLPSLQIRDRED